MQGQGRPESERRREQRRRERLTGAQLTQLGLDDRREHLRRKADRERGRLTVGFGRTVVDPTKGA